MQEIVITSAHQGMPRISDPRQWSLQDATKICGELGVHEFQFKILQLILGLSFEGLSM